MSAKNWRACPRCAKKATLAQAECRRVADRAYGQVPAEEYRKLAAEAERQPVIREAMREDYQLGVGIDGGFSVVYRATCQECDFAFEFKHEEAARV